MASVTLLIFLLTTALPGLLSQSTSIAQNAFDSLEGLGCSQFKSIIMEANRQNRYQSTIPLTLFVFNNSAYEALPSYMRDGLYDQTNDNAGADEYVSTFTLSEVISTSSFTNAAPQKTMSVKSRMLFLNAKSLLQGDVASGTPGPTQYFANGGIVSRGNIQAGQHVIHILDRVLPLPLEDNALAYVSKYNPNNLRYAFFTEFMDALSYAAVNNPVESYDEQVRNVLTDLSQPVTFFLPSDQAVNNIPEGLRSELLANTDLLLKIIMLHIVPKQALYTSLVNHNEQFNTQYNSGRVIFRTNYDREAVYVSGALSGGSTVTARINDPNVTVLNGVIHHIDEVLGYVYKTVQEEINIDPVTGNFETLIARARIDLQGYVTANQNVYVFAPTNEALDAIKNRYENYLNDANLINMILERNILKPDQMLVLTDHNGGYESYTTAKSRYNDELVKVYSEGNDTWVEGGYVKARVVKPDIGCVNGIVHQIDAVFGVPTRDMPYAIFCEEKLESTFIQLQFVGLDNYMRDPALPRNQACRSTSGTVSGSSVPNDGTYGTISSISSSTSALYDQYEIPCGDYVNRCEFTFFVPNGTAIDNFFRLDYGRTIGNDIQRWRWILRRHMTFREVIHLDRMAPGVQRVMYTDNGDEVIIQTDSRSNLPSGQRISYILFESVKVQVIHSDLDVTNGVMHIVDGILFVPDDLTRDVSAARPSAKVATFTLVFGLLLCLALSELRNAR